MKEKMDFDMVRKMSDQNCDCYLCRKKKATHKVNGLWTMANGRKGELFAYLCPDCIMECLNNKDAEIAIIKMNI